MSNSMTALDSLTMRFGVKKMIKMVEFSLPYLSQREQELRESLLSGDRDTASHTAHKAISSVRLYGSPKLEALLYQVRDGDYGANVEALQKELSKEFTFVTNVAKAWLMKHIVALDSQQFSI